MALSDLRISDILSAAIAAGLAYVAVRPGTPLVGRAAAGLAVAAIGYNLFDRFTVASNNGTSPYLYSDQVFSDF